MAAYYMDVLETVLLPYLLDGPFPGGLCHFQRDGALIHTEKKVRELLDSFGIITVDWPSRSPELNIIENVWGLMKRNLAKQLGLGTCNTDDLWCAIETKWVRLRNDSPLVDHLCKSLSQRIESLRWSGGAAMRYCMCNHLQSQLMNYDKISAAAKLLLRLKLSAMNVRSRNTQGNNTACVASYYI